MYKWTEILEVEFLLGNHGKDESNILFFNRGLKKIDLLDKKVILNCSVSKSLPVHLGAYAILQSSVNECWIDGSETVNEQIFDKK